MEMKAIASLPLAPPPTVREWLAESLKVGLLSFGGAAGQIAMMHRMFVEERRWVSEREFLDGLNFCTLLPGPEAQQLSTYLGWRLHGIPGGLVSGILFVLPGAIFILILAQAYVIGAGIPTVAALLLGIKAAVIAIVTEAVLKIGRRALTTNGLRAVGMLAFAAMMLTTLPFPALIGLAALAGIPLTRGSTALAARDVSPSPAFPWMTAGLTLAAWWLPVALAALILGSGHLLVEVGLFFSKLAVITFGGAYALLSYLAEESVRRGWADARQMIDALGLAETTPGPTILVNPFVAFLAGAKSGGGAMAWLAGIMAIWTTFAPSFLWIFTGGPLMSRVTRSAMLSGALRGISAAVVGIIASVATKFAIFLFFAAPQRIETGFFATLLPGGAVEWKALGLAAIAFGLLFALKLGLLRMLAIMILLGLGGSLVPTL